MALLCYATFNVSPLYYASVLSDNREVALLIELAIRAAKYIVPRTLNYTVTPILDVLLFRHH